jgi:biopolymer transport protein ExbB
MKNKMSLSPKTSTKLSLKKILIYSVLGGGAFSFLIYIGLTFFGVIGNPDDAIAAQVTGYNWEAMITIDNTKVSGSSNLIDFPVLVKITNSRLKSISNGGMVENINGYDIVFSDMNDDQLDHQLESYNPSTGEYIAWVRLPTISSNIDTDFKMFYGNTNIIANLSTEDIWTSNYQAVWHMNNDPTNSIPQLIDGTANTRDGSSYGAMTSSDLVVGKIGLANEFDGTNDYYKITGYKGVIGTNKRTVSMWFKSNVTSNYSHRLISWGKNQTGKKYDMRVNGGNKALRIENAGGQHYGATNINDGNWHLLTIVLPSNPTPKVKDHLLYVDGVLETVTNGGNRALNTASQKDVYIAQSNWHCCNTRGVLDEIRIINTCLSPEWIATEFENQNSPNDFYSIVFNNTPLPVELIDFNVELIDNSVKITWSTATEINNDYFTIEKAINTVNYEVVDEVVGAGNSNSIKQYSYIDDNVFEGLSYYRLKQTDFDGKFEYFPPQAINNNIEASQFKISTVKPNPFTSQFTVVIESKNAGMADFILSGMNGKRIHDIQIELNEGRTEYNYIDGNKLTSGTYLLNIKKNDIVTTVKIIKK